MGKRYALFTRDDRIIHIQITNADTGLPEYLDYYETREVAEQALALMKPEMIDKHGAHVREVGEA